MKNKNCWDSRTWSKVAGDNEDIYIPKSKEEKNEDKMVINASTGKVTILDSDGKVIGEQG